MLPLALALIIAQPAPAPAKDVIPATITVPDENWVPAPSDRGYTDLETYAATDLFSYVAMVKAVRARDDAGMRELEQKRSIARVADKTPFLVIQRHPQPLVGIYDAVEVRLQGGPYNGQKAWLVESNTTRFVEVPNPALRQPQRQAEPKPRPKAKTFEPNMARNQVSNLFRAARQLETAGKFQEAGKAYRELVLDYSLYPEARLAADRLRVLGMEMPAHP